MKRIFEVQESISSGTAVEGDAQRPYFILYGGLHQLNTRSGICAIDRQINTDDTITELSLSPAAAVHSPRRHPRQGLSNSE